MDIKARIREVLETTHLMSLGTLFEGNILVSDVVFIYDDNLNIYWMSDPDARHSQAIVKNNKVAGTITLSTQSKMPNFGIQFTGVAEKIEGERYDLAKKHFKKRNHPEPAETDDVLDGDSWYMLTPDNIGLIDEENFGFKKQTLKL